MLRRAALLLATVLVCGCQTSGPPGTSASPYGNPRVPPPGTNSYSKPDIYYPGGSNPAGTSGTAGAASPSSTTSSGFNPTRIFSPQPQAGQNPAPGSSWPIDGSANRASLFADRSGPQWGNSTSGGVTPARYDDPDSRSTQPQVRFGDTTAPSAGSAIRLKGMPANDVTKAPAPRGSASTARFPEITNLPSVGFSPQPAAGFAPSLAPNFAPTYAPGYVPPYGAGVPYTPGSTANQTAASSSGGSGELRWKSKAPSSVSGGTTLR